MFEFNRFRQSYNRPLLMGIVNATGDSFSEGSASSASDALDRALRLLDDGADLLDVGGESTRPSAREVPAEEELERIVPLVRELKRRRPDVVLSVDTRKSMVARAVLELGVEIINDVSLLRYDPALARTVAEYGAALVLCHSRGTPENMRSEAFCVYPEGVVAGVMRELSPAAESAAAAGVRPENIIYDPGIGFAKTPEQDWTLLREIGKFRTLGPVLAGISRKSFLGAFLDQKEPQLRLGGTLAGVLYLADAGVEILRVHDVRQAGDALRVHWKLREGK